MTDGRAYEVRVRDSVERSVDVVRVLAGSEQEAIDLVVEWIDAYDRRPLAGSQTEVHDFSSGPSDDLLGIATQSERVYFHRTDFNGRDLSTPFYIQG